MAIRCPHCDVIIVRLGDCGSRPESLTCIIEPDFGMKGTGPVREWEALAQQEYKAKQEAAARDDAQAGKRATMGDQ